MWSAQSSTILILDWSPWAMDLHVDVQSHDGSMIGVGCARSRTGPSRAGRFRPDVITFASGDDGGTGTERRGSGGAACRRGCWQLIRRNPWRRRRSPYDFAASDLLNENFETCDQNERIIESANERSRGLIRACEELRTIDFLHAKESKILYRDGAIDFMRGIIELKMRGLRINRECEARGGRSSSFMLKNLKFYTDSLKEINIVRYEKVEGKIAHAVILTKLYFRCSICTSFF